MALILPVLPHTGLPMRRAWQKNSEDKETLSYLERRNMNRGLFSPTIPEGDPSRKRRQPHLELSQKKDAEIGAEKNTMLTSWICFGSSNTTLQPVRTSIITYKQYIESQLHTLKYIHHNQLLLLTVTMNIVDAHEWLCIFLLMDYTKLTYKTMSNRKSIDLKVKAFIK